MMRRAISAIAAATILLSNAAVRAEDADKSGAALGKWTQDFDAATKLAKEKQLPILLNFSGSDWCGWCKLMAKNVFSTEEWSAYAKENIVMVLLDFPKDKSLVPEAFLARNEELQQKYEVRGFPTYIILDSDGQTVLGQLGASREATPASFISDLTAKLKYCAGEVGKYASTLSAGDKEKYMAIMKKLADCKTGMAGARESIAQAEKKIEELEEQTKTVQAEATEFRAAQKGPEALEEYKSTKAELDKVVAEMDAFIKQNPDRTNENVTKVRAMMERAEGLREKLSSY
jgi:thioredoxin-related protein